MNNTPSRAKRRYLVIPFAIFGVMFAIYSAFWFYAARIMQTEVDAFISGQEQMGRTVSFKERRLSGYPFSLRTRLDNFVWSDDAEEWHWSGDRLYIITLPYDVTRIVLAPRNDQTYRLRGQTFDITGRVNVGLKNGAYSAEGDDISIRQGGRVLELKSLRANWDEGADRSWTFLGAIRQTRYTDENGDTAEVPFWNMVLKGQALSLENIEITGTELAVTDGVSTAPSLLGATGKIGVTRSGFLDGNLNLSIRNEQAMLALVQRFGLASSSDISQAETMLGAMTSGGTQEATIPFRFKDGDAYVGPVKIAEIGRVN